MPITHGRQTITSDSLDWSGRWCLAAMWMMGKKLGSAANMGDALDLETISSNARPFVL